MNDHQKPIYIPGPKTNMSAPENYRRRPAAMEERPLPLITDQERKAAAAAAPPAFDEDGNELFPEEPEPPAPIAAAPSPKPPAVFEIQALLDEFPVTVTCEGTAEVLKATVKRLREIGAVPPTPAARAEVAAEREREAPVCQWHGPMKESLKAPGTWFCTKKMGDGSYCKSKA